MQASRAASDLAGLGKAVNELALEQAVHAWLHHARRQVLPRFPKALEALFQADTASSRLLALKISLLLGVLTGIGMTPAFWELMPDAHAYLIRGWILVALPVLVLSLGALWTRIPIQWQERQAASAALVVGLILSGLMQATRIPLPGIDFGGVLLLVLLFVIAGGVRFGIAAVLTAGLNVMFLACIFRIAGMDDVRAGTLGALMVICSISVLVGCWRVETGSRYSYVLILRERLQQKVLSLRNVELDALALRDPLTGLANRRAYDSWQKAAWQSAELAGAAVGLVVVDIDYFKRYNDFYGHPSGDVCLQVVGRCMAEQLRGTTDLVARLGGEEFAILLPGANLAAAGDVAERMRAAVEAMQVPHGGCGPGATLTISCGASSMMGGTGTSPAALFAAADAALYEAKLGGRNRVALAEHGPADPAEADRHPQANFALPRG